LGEVRDLDSEVIPGGNGPTSANRKQLRINILLGQIASSIGLRKFLESGEKNTIYIPIFIRSANALRKILKLSTNKGKLFVLNCIVEPVMIPVFIPFVLITNNMNIDITAILELERSKLGHFANKSTISDLIHLQRLMVHCVHPHKIGSRGGHSHCLASPHANTKPKNDIRSEMVKIHLKVPKSGNNSPIKGEVKSSSKQVAKNHHFVGTRCGNSFRARGSALLFLNVSRDHKLC
jgi:hypothetical protein